MHKVSTAALALVLVALGVRVSAQPPQPKPGPEHEIFKKYEGVWEATVETKEGKSQGIMMWKVGLGGLWLLEHFKSDGVNPAFEGMGATSYDAAKKKYVGVWIDSMSTAPMNIEGTYDKAKKTMNSVGTAAMPDGKTAKMTMTTVMEDGNNMVFTMTTPGPDGKDFQIMKISYTRKAK